MRPFKVNRWVLECISLMCQVKWVAPRCQLTGSVPFSSPNILLMFSCNVPPDSLLKPSLHLRLHAFLGHRALTSLQTNKSSKSSSLVLQVAFISPACDDGRRVAEAMDCWRLLVVEMSKSVKLSFTEKVVV